MLASKCHLLPVVDAWMQEVVQRHQEHILDFTGIRLGLEIVAYKAHYWGYPYVFLQAENKEYTVKS